MVHHVGKIQRLVAHGPQYVGHDYWPQVRSTSKCIESTMKPTDCPNSKGDTEAMGLGRPLWRSTELQANKISCGHNRGH